MTNAEFAILCKAFIEATEEQKQAAINLMTEEEQKAFITGVGCFRIMTDKEYHDKIMAETMKQYLNA